MLRYWYQLFIALLFSLCVNMVSADEYLSHSEKWHDVETPLVLEEAVFTHPESAPLTDEHGPLLNSTSGHYFLSISRKLVSTDNCADQGVVPEYFLLIAFLSPPLLQLATQAQRPLATQLHWTSHTAQSRSRLSGWKEANTLYSQKHTRPS
ncbi:MULTISPECIES: hypothetical protein [unclassified Agarivorans]|uniref:hypothetical protein n=1 Tax=unclassified Agarivorans TaxID=2636026 RepID=UPI0026E11F85|nr:MULTISPECIES: hypothetical protein [unclassified Agarivorans]MDO6688080.1 hypothetical protein [Agarivorans sp. 3_MG-2023]MDO6717675.1 hypothetical protein [Agarivorans sp. 2_MG-2023]MDO6765118.1 hypothetical protein [Agarivorans sp. 1_MG-2023]